MNEALLEEVHGHGAFAAGDVVLAEGAGERRFFLEPGPPLEVAADLVFAVEFFMTMWAEYWARVSTKTV